MSGSSELAGDDARTQNAHRQSQNLERNRLRLHDRLLRTAESVRRSHVRAAETMEHLADTGSAEYAPRRRRAAERSRRLADEEARQIAELMGRELNHDSGTDDRPGTEPS